MNDTAAALNKTFSQADITQAHLTELYLSLTAYLEKHNKGDEHASARLQDELRIIYKSHVDTNPRKLGPFISTLKTLRPSMNTGRDITRWFDTTIKPFVEQLGSRRTFVDDAQDFVVGGMLYDEEDSDAREKAHASSQLTHKVLQEYMARARLLAGDEETISYKTQNQALLQLQSMLIAFGRKQPKVSHTLLTRKWILTIAGSVSRSR